MRPWQPLLAGCLLLVGCCGPEPLPPECTAPCHRCCEAARSHVYVFLIDGLDPLDCAAFCKVRDFLTAQGFIKCYSGRPYHVPYFAKEIRRLHNCPDNRFVLIGHGTGADAAASIAHAVQTDGIEVDTVLYLDACVLRDSSFYEPENVRRVVNVQSAPCVGKGAAPLDHAENQKVPDAGPLGLPNNPRTLQTIAEEVAAVARLVSVPPPPDLNPHEGWEHAPTPRPVAPQPVGERDEWDFLKPVPRIEKGE